LAQRLGPNKMRRMRSDFGDPTNEYLAARSGRGLVGGICEVVWVEGPDAVTFLDGQLSQELAADTEGRVTRSLLLEPRGKLVAILDVLTGDSRVGLVVDSGFGAGVRDRLERFRFRVDAAISLEGAETHQLWGPGAGSTARVAGFDCGDGWRQSDSGVVARLPGPFERILVIGDPDRLLEQGAVRVGAAAWTSVRIEAGLPLMGVDVDESTIPQETGLVDDTVSFTKGCFVGQELVARIDSRGRVNRRLVGIRVGTNVLPPPGTQVLHDGQERGAVTSVGESLALRCPVGLATVRREVDDGADVVLRWDEGEAPGTVAPLPLDDFSGPVHSSLTGFVEGGAGTSGAT